MTQSDLSPRGYFYAEDEATVQAAADAITTAWDPNQAARWDYVREAADGSGFYTQKHDDDACNVGARAIEGINEGPGSEAWFEEEEE